MPYPFGKYQLLRKIATGGMGQVFVARVDGDADTHRLVVIKRLLPHLLEDPEFVEMFLQEARLAARLHHPNIVRIFELGEVKGSAYIAMEYLPGEDLRRVWLLAFERKAPLPLGAVCRILSDAAAGLSYAHTAEDENDRPLGLVHRDVSPQNILVGFRGQVKLIDFGVAKARNRIQHTASGVLKGKFAYLSPEHAMGKHVDARSDLFSLGIVFWEALTGKRLFKADSDLMTARLIEDCIVPPPSRVNPALPKSIDAVVLRALAKRREDRYPDAETMREAIEDFVLNNGIASSEAHLGAVLKSLYAERLQQELVDPQQLDRLKPGDDINVLATPSRPLFPVVELPQAPVRSPSREVPRAKTGESLSRAGTSGTFARAPSREISARAHSRDLLAVSSSELSEDTQVSKSLQRSRRALWPLMAGGGASVVAIGVTLALFFASRGPPGGGRENTVVPVAVMHVEPSGTGPAPSVALTVLSDPPGARVLIGGKPVGVTPFAFAVARGAVPLTVQLTLPGYDDAEAELSVENAPVLAVKLTARAKRHPLAKKGARVN